MPILYPIYPKQEDSYSDGLIGMMKNREFAVLVGRAFLYETNIGNRDSALAFGRAFLLALGMEGPEQDKGRDLAKGRPYGESCALAEN